MRKYTDGPYLLTWEDGVVEAVNVIDDMAYSQEGASPVEYLEEVDATLMPATSIEQVMIEIARKSGKCELVTIYNLDARNIEWLCTIGLFSSAQRTQFLAHKPSVAVMQAWEEICRQTTK